MNLYTIDLETYYDKDYSLLSKMPTWEYILDPRFELICGVVVDPENKIYRFKDESSLVEYLKSIEGRKGLLCQNTAFDGAILSWRYGITFDMYFDTMLLARPYDAAYRSCSLASLAPHYGVGEKGFEVAKAIGLRRCDFGPRGIELYLDYCQNDTVITKKLFEAMLERHKTPALEIRSISNTLRAYIEPRIILDLPKLKEYATRLAREKEEKLQALGVTEKQLRSDATMAQLLVAEGIDPPTKINKNGETKFAFAKSDEEFMALRESDNETVSLLVTTRLGVKTTIEQSRTDKLIKLGSMTGGELPVPLKYWGAHTGRLSGWDEINLQNLKKGTPIRDSLVAPDGHVFCVSDSSQIEARLNAWVSGQTDLVNAFKRGEDVYSQFATELFNCLVRKPKKTDPPDVYKDLEVKRFIGKTCILGLGYGMGAKKLHATIISQSTTLLGTKIDPGFAFCQNAVRLYRMRFPMIKNFWYQCDNALLAFLTGQPYNLGHGITFDKSLWLPNGMPIHYPKLRREDEQFIFTTKSGRTERHKFLWGGTMVENICQSLAGAIIRYQWDLLVKQGISVVHQVHDEIVCLVKENEADTMKEIITSTMRQVPSWMEPNLITCEANCGKTYGEAK